MPDYTFQYSVPYADVQWNSNGTPESSLHRDPYYSVDDGLAESNYVFLELTRVAERWRHQTRFTIAELGFGTGLNFLLTMQRWQATAPAASRLIYVSFEKHPLRLEDLQRAHKQFPELKSDAEALYQRLPWLHSGINPIHFADQGITLLLVVGAAQEYLPNMRFTADAWYLDGFAPSKNESMWTPSLFKEVAKHSGPGTICSTFSAARIVKDSLAAAGFSVSKVAGWGRKRDSLVATFPATRNAKDGGQHPSRIAVIGGGIAGCLVARALALRGAQPTILEAQPHLAAGASGNAAAMVKPDYSAVPDIRSELSIMGFALLRRLCLELDLPAAACSFQGIFRSPRYGRLQRFMQVFPTLEADSDWIRSISANEIYEKTDLAHEESGLFYPNAGRVNPSALCEALSSCATIQYNSKVDSLKPLAAGWTLLDETASSLGDFEAVVIANSIAAESLLGVTIPGMTFNYGQVLEYSNHTGTSPKIPVIGPGYALSPTPSSLLLGATYEHSNEAAEQEQKRVQLLLEMEAFLQIPGLAENVNFKSRRNIRCNASDRLPLAGPWCNPDKFASVMGTDLDPRHLVNYTLKSATNNVYLAIGLGSKGFTLGPVVAELLAAHICGEALPVTERCLRALLLSRYIARDIRKAGKLATPHEQTV